MALPLIGGRRIRERYAWILAGAVSIAALALGIAQLREPEPERDTYRFVILPPEGATLDEGFALSPDGRNLVFTATDAVGKSLLFLRSLDSTEARALPGTEGSSYPFWSPDSRFVGFHSLGKLRKIDIAGGPPQVLCDAATHRGGAWNRDGVMLFAPLSGGPLYRVSDSGGVGVPLTTLDSARQENAHRWPLFLPDGKHFLYVARSANPDHTGIYLRSLDSDESRRLIGAYSSVVYVPPYLLYVRGETLMAQPFDASRLELTGEPFPVLEKVGSFLAMGKSHLSASENGVLAYRTHSSSYVLPIWFDRDGIRLGVLGSTADYSNPNLSPDERKLAFGRADPQTGTPDIWLLDLDRGTTSRFTSHTAGDYFPVWSPDGSRIVFASNRLSDGGTSLY
ncbi:MAG: TolB family protein, partial [Vicinamibacteria bacterium]